MLKLAKKLQIDILCSEMKESGEIMLLREVRHLQENLIACGHRLDCTLDQLLLAKIHIAFGVEKLESSVQVLNDEQKSTVLADRRAEIENEENEQWRSEYKEALLNRVQERILKEGPMKID